jgi:hypothetical protein
MSVDSETMAIWGSAIISAIDGDRKELCELLICGNKVTHDLAIFLAWLLSKNKKNGRAALTEKFKSLRQFSHPLFDAVMDFEQQRAIWRYSNPRRQFPYKLTLDGVAASGDVDSSKLDTELRRSKRSGQKLGFR